jgi:exonuclease III
MTKSTIMMGTFWNIRGLNKTGILQCLFDFVRINRLDFVVIQETKKETISNSFLESVSKNFSWNYKLAKGTAGGILVGMNNSGFDILGWQCFQ